MINHELQNYDYSEGIEFNPLMPEVMSAEGVKTIGGSEKSVRMFGVNARGNDQLETIDIPSFYEDEEQNSTSDENQGTQGYQGE